MPWQTKKLGDLCEIELGKTPYRGNMKFWDRGKQTKNVWLSIADLLHAYGNVVSDSKEYISDKGVELSKIVKKGTLLASFKLTLGRLAFAGKDLYTNEAIAALTIKNEKEISKNYLYYFLTFFDWYGEVKGDIKIKGKTLNKAKLKDIKILYPESLPEQRRIVEKLDKVFGEVKKAKENAEKNLRNAKELFESYLQGVFENQGNPASAKSYGVAKWDEKKLEEIADIKKIKNTKKGLPYVGMEDIESNTARFLGALKPKNVKSSSFYFSADHILYGRLRPYLNKILLPDFEGHCSTEIFPIKVRQEIDKRFLFYWFIQNKTVQAINKTCTGTRMPRANMKEIFNFLINFPKSITEQRAIVGRLDGLAGETKKLEGIYRQKLADLEELKKSVLRKAFSGEL